MNEQKNRYNSREKKEISNNTVIATDKPARAGYAAQQGLSDRAAHVTFLFTKG